jgi:N-hydroxyarylamine O-acetyltransferase
MMRLELLPGYVPFRARKGYRTFMKIEDYLNRIGLKSAPRPTLEGLRTVHRAHLFAIPYENFDVQLGRPLTTDVAAACEKIVAHRRGGWCYEMNGLLGWALQALGFRVTRASGAVKRDVRGDAIIGNHLVLRVDLPEGVWLADAGFGDGPVEPLCVAEGSYTVDGFTHRIERLDEVWWRMQNHPVGSGNTFDFTTAPADEAVLARMCSFLQTAPVSPFVQNAVAQRCGPGVVTMLRGRMLRHVRPAGYDERLIESADDLLETLRCEFALDLPEAAGLWPKIVKRHDDVMAELAATPG